ncbi:hypothetical protein N7491_000210 [Penicillium cf. griseofulvum]|uniref:Uncharacterized protein n=1 Tax=Penicillium cf. griseofulvum TaxID=2972120 RepID=A0A9W9JLP9_9EURO|nr:hypothetical protein N7472_004437 [Penicillium cf. griseofulvum]KAJ5451028.1 hypothetical protein N7491_000210 [Penicillium cf. griseofulvum]
MAPLKIVLQGTSCITRQPERGALRLIIQRSGSSQDSVSKDVTETSNEINQLFKELSPRTETGETISGSPVTSFSSTSLHTGSQQPPHISGKPQPMVYYASLVLNALFQDFTKLNEIVGMLISHPNVEIQSLDWCLTEVTKKALSSESRQDAMRDAVQKANDYASVIGREVVAVSISEIGGGTQLGLSPLRYNSRMQNAMQMQQLQQAQQAQMPPQPSIASMAAITSPALDSNPNFGASGALNLSPQLIRYTDSVQVEFEAVSS